MDIATGPLRTLLPKLAKLLQDEYKLQKGTRKGIQFLYEELETMHAALRIVDEVPREQLNDLQRIWVRDVKELSYDMEDIVDTFMVDIEGPDPPSKKGVKKIFKRMRRKVTKAMARREVTQEINDIKKRAKELAERHDRYKVDDIAPANKTPVDPRLKALFTDATETVGIEEAKEEVITMLRERDDEKKRIVSIAGFGGLGKTTLAKAVYDEVKGQFHRTAFVSVSRSPDPKKLLMDMMHELAKKGDPGPNSDEIKHLIYLVRQYLQNERYLIVFDDIWDKESWDEVIGHVLIENNKSSRIITTTRNVDVAEHAGGCYRLKPLSDENSSTLFYGRIFGSKDKCPMQFSEVSKKILKKCGGVPLAIVTTSSLLANKSKTIKEWFSVCESIGSGLRKNPDMDRMRKILLLSYYDLPSYLKTCLLYLSIFPEDSVIRKDGLIWKWVAEGFIQVKKGDQSFLEIGESYFNELLNRSLIQAADKVDMEGTPKACRVHDTVLDLINSLSSKESFISIVSGDGMESKVSGDEMESKVRWLSVHNNTTWPTMKMPKLRSLTIFTQLDDVVVDPTISSHRLLRVLDLRSCKLKDIASLGFLGGLSHLRYLALSSSDGEFDDSDDIPDELPIEIGKLRFLQTLDLSKTRVQELQASVIKGLGQLMCLRGSWNTTVLRDGLKNLTSLEVLESATVTSERIAEELGHLTKLRTLFIAFSTQEDDELRAYGKALVGSLGKLAKIESLRIHSTDNYQGSNDLDGPMEEPLANLQRLCIHQTMFLPTWIKGALLPGLSYLDIKVEFERREDIQVLGTLPCLRHLRFSVMCPLQHHKVLERCVVGPHAFPCMVSCELIGVEGVVPSLFRRGAMQMLENFKFTVLPEQFCSGGGWTVDDLGLDHLPSLRSVTVDGLFCSQYHDQDKKDTIRNAREKLEHEAAVHPNHPIINWHEGVAQILQEMMLASMVSADRDHAHCSGQQVILASMASADRDRADHYSGPS